MELIILISFMISAALASYFFTLPITTKLTKRIPLLNDMNKPPRKIPGTGGLPSFFGFVLVINVFILFNMIFSWFILDLHLLLPGLLTVTLISFLGLIDDLVVFKNKLIKIMFSFFAALPLMSVVYTENLRIFFPFIGSVNMGLYYPLLIIPLIIILCSNAVNLMADFDGLAPGFGLVISIGMLIISIIAGNITGIVFFIMLIGAVTSMFYFNKYPSKVFCGNIGTLFLGASLGTGAVIANREQAMVIMMIPYFIHFILQERIIFEKGLLSRPRERGFLQEDGTLKSEYKKSYGLTHFIMLHFRNVTEKKLVLYLIIFEIFFTSIAILNELGKLYIY